MSSLFKSLPFLLLLIGWSPTSGQTLNLPPRPPDAPNGTQFTNLVSSLPRDKREDRILTEILSGNVPDFLRTLVPINVSDSGHTGTYYVTPDYLAIGDNTDYFLCPMTPLLAQRLCDLLGYTLPTRKMVNQIWTNASVKLNPQPITARPEMITVPVFAWHNFMVRTQRNAFTNSFPLGALVGSGKKDVIISARIYTNFATAITKPVVIYGWHYPNGSPIQSLYNGHEETYADYSHGIRLVQMNLTVDGAPNTVANVLTSPTLAPLLSDDGPSEGTSGGVIPLPRYTIPGQLTFTAHPRSQTVAIGNSIVLSAIATGEAPASYRWLFNGANIPNATNSSLLLTNVGPGNAGSYTAVATNFSGAVASRPAIVRVKSTDFPILFSDDFETNSAANWNLFWGATNGVPDYTANWAFDYGGVSYTFNGVTNLIPAAPNSADGQTRALKFTVNNNDTLAAIAAVNVYPQNFSVSGNFALKFDLWINYPGNAGGTGTGVAGSTQHAIFGLNHFGTNVNWAAPSAGASDGLWFAATGEGGDSRDYRSYVGNPTGTQIDLTGSATSGLIGTNHTTAAFQSLFPATRFETQGAPGKNWVEVELRYTNNIVVWIIDGTVVCLRTNTSGFTSGNLMLGFMDTLPSIAAPAKDAFVLFDNVRVENLAPPIQFTAITHQPNGHINLAIITRWATTSRWKSRPT
ncbi:MAG TPA: immunoglobulin domain-containing protein [Verrucomicrobiae bacterium]|nr:immunoglobulin domain-containing protein [Verrucomicrobiae bacterium]